MMIIDLDGFKSVNDNFGHLAGDSVLKQVANRIQTAVLDKNADAIVARMGGDEFSVFISYNKVQEIADISNDVVTKISDPCEALVEPVSLGASIGISLCGKDSSVYGQLLYYADVAMYQTKKSGGSNYQFFSQAMCPDAKE